MGSIVANEGFIKKFATVADPDTGAPALNANHVSLWSAVTYASQILFQLLSPITADRWGRKLNLWILTFFLTLVSTSVPSTTTANQADAPCSTVDRRRHPLQ